MNHEVSLKIAQLRAKQSSGDKLTQEELREAIDLMRSARGQAHAVSATARSRKATKAAIDSDSLLDELSGL